MDDNHFRLFSGTSHPALARQVAGYLGIELGELSIGVFPDNEISVQVMESVRNQDCFVLQSIALNPNTYLMELLIVIDALRRASAKSIVAVIPYFGYGRQDRKDRARVPITAKLVANLLVNAGATRILTMDLHAGQIQGFFDIPLDNLYGRPQMVRAVQGLGLDNPIVVTPDVGSATLGRDFATQLGCGLAVIDKRRESATQVEISAVMGDVTGKDVLLADDMVSTGGSLVSAAQACREKGARQIFAAVTHGLFVGNAVAKIEESPIDQVLYSNTIPPSDRLAQATKLRQVSIANLLGKAMRCIMSAESISSLFTVETTVS